ncbi:MAG: BatD family protein, partial [Candidatus Omnitrophica bacterium]|nr:BatD family protein [Candidatus Omnitrophota bacterium]
SYSALVFNQSLFAIKEGNYVIGPAQLNCNLMVKKETPNRVSRFSIDGFFSGRFGYRSYPVALESNEIPVTILPFPSEGKPLGFQGAVGDFNLDVYVKQFKVKVGDPITVRMSVTGDGNLDTVTAPEVGFIDDFKTYEPQIDRQENKKVYEQIFIPKNNQVSEIPVISFSFFNPDTEKYETTRKGPFPIEVIERPVSEQGVKMVSIAGLEQTLYPQEKLGEDVIYVKEDIGDIRPKGALLFKNKIFLAIQMIPLIVFIIFYMLHQKRERMHKDETYARFMKAPRRARKGIAKAKTYFEKGEVGLFYDTVFSTLQNYLSGRLHLPIGNVTIQEIEGKLKGAADNEVLNLLKNVFSACEMARYASSGAVGMLSVEEREVMEKVKRIIDHMEKMKI